MLKASFSYQIYSNGDFSVNKFLVKECSKDDFCAQGDIITVLGNNVPIHKKIVYLLEGAWEQNKKTKEIMQFRLYGYQEEKPKNGNEVLAYLESGVIKGIGKRNAALIYERFGSKSLDIIENDTERLLEIKGFGKKTVGMIKESYLKNLKSKDSLLFLASLGINSKQGTKVYERFKENTREIVNENPYELCNVKGIGFEIADSVAKSLGVSENSQKRIEAGILWTLKILENEEGNIGSPIKTLEKRLYQLLGLARNSENVRIVNQVSSNMVKEKKVIISKELCFRPHMFELETECASHIVRLLKGKPFKVKKDYMEVIKKIESELHICLDEIQRMAVEKAVLENFLVITGGPGSGKTTTILSIIKVLETIFQKCTIKLMAPTGRAARRMSETTGYYASTIHSGLRISTETEEDYGAESLEEDIIIVDEVSMLDLRIATLLLRAVDDGKKVILIGDCDQLPSVGPGAVLRDIISSNAVPVVKLERIFRQDKESNIYVNSRKIKNGSTDLNEGSDFFILESDGFAESADIMARIYEEKVSEYGISNVACLTPYRKHTAGCEHMNQVLQEIVNPYKGQSQIKHHDVLFRNGDLVMNLVNATKGDIDIANGDIGTVCDVNESENTLTVSYFDDIYVKYESDELDSLDLAYSYTVHKSQGAQYPCVITNLCTAHIDKMKTRNIIYTAITRATKEVIFVGDRKALDFSINHVIEDDRNTLLSEKIIFMNKKYNLLH